ncbi:hypothetical protein AV521_36900 [Streptomyces sp. IMTB 2501]|nr:hypothetical protein AV521_36900 [Streptomyces sp. IMTB 2501]
MLTWTGVAEPDELRAIQWDPALATAAGIALFPGMLEGLMTTKDTRHATDLVTPQKRDRLSWRCRPSSPSWT